MGEDVVLKDVIIRQGEYPTVTFIFEKDGEPFTRTMRPDSLLLAMEEWVAENLTFPKNSIV